MARLRATTKHDDSAEILAYYRALTARPYEPENLAYPPARIGPSWATDDAGRFELPEHSLGWASLVWTGQKLKHDGKPWMFTAEQARLWLWWYAVDESGTFVFDREGVIQRLKGWGKDPFAAALCITELVGPCRFGGFDGDQLLVVDEPSAWVQIAAVTQEQTKNTMRLFPSLIPAATRGEYGIQIGKEQIYARGGERFLQAVTSNPAPLEGGRATLTLLNETHHFKAANNGLAMLDMVERNATKSNGGASRLLHITNAYNPGEDSAAERTRIAYESSLEDKEGVKRSQLSGMMYDSLEAPPDAPLTAEDAEEVVRGVRGDSTWLDLDRIRKSILDPRNPPSRSRRFWYNQITANEESWVSPMDWDAQSRPELSLQDRDEIVMFFDGSKSDDATALVGCRVSDGLVVPLGLWQAPPMKRRGEWVVDRAAVNLRIRALMKQYRVVGFWADPSHTKEDGTLDRFWQPLIDEWHRDFHHKLTLWAQPGRDGHSIAWDMSNTSSKGKGAIFVPGAEAFVEDVENGDLIHDGSAELARHVKNARRFPTRFGVSLSKDGPESPRKIDLAVCAVGARIMRRQVLNTTSRRRGGRIW